MNRIETLEKASAWVRWQVLEMIDRAGKGHIGGSLSCVDILVTLYVRGILNISPATSNSPDRDRLIFSKGHACEALYAVLARSGFFPESILQSYGQNGTMLGGHPDRRLPGVEVSTGSLGHGLGIGAGLAMALRQQKRAGNVFVMLGDGECYEGSIWESAMFAAHHRLTNLIAIVDRNGEITLDETENCNALEPFGDKWRSMGWRVETAEGHSFPSLIAAFDRLVEAGSDRPGVLIAGTIKGKGISFMEQEVGWHHTVPKGAKLELARKELQEAMAI